jgi:cobalt transporter subunit CbtA
MIARVLLAVILSGIAAGLVMGVIQHVRLTPLVLQAETYEHVAHGHSAEPHQHGDDVWSPADGLERTFFTTLSSVLAATGFAFLLAGLSIVGNRPISFANGLLWGMCGFFAVAFAPAIGLPPQLPGMAEAALQQRQLWWVGTVLASGLGLWILTSGKSLTTLIPALLLLIVPHMFLLPKNSTETSTVPATLAAQFVTASLGANLMMWSVLGLSLGYFLERSKPHVD